MLISSCVTVVDVLIIDQARSTQARCSALTHFHIFPLLDLPLLHLLHLCARWPTSLPGQVLPSSNAHALSCKGTQTSFATGHNRIVSQSLKGCWQTTPSLRHSRPYHPNKCFRFVYHFELLPFFVNMCCLS